jgi:hypothetical protein
MFGPFRNEERMMHVILDVANYPLYPHFWRGVHIRTNNITIYQTSNVTAPCKYGFTPVATLQLFLSATSAV